MTLTPTQATPTPGETETVTPVPTEDGVSIVPVSGGTVVGLNGKLQMIIPDQALSEAIQVSITLPAEDALPAYTLSGQPFEIDAVGQTSLASVHHFAKPVTLILDYSAEDLWGSEDGLVLKYYDETLKEWMTLPSWVDTEKKLLYAVTDHLTLFDFDIDNWQSSMLPRMDGAQVSDYTGAASYSIPIEVPDGPGGLKPSLSLDYNSQVVDSSTVQTQADWVGMGWSIDTGYVERNMYGTDDSLQDDSFNLVLNGVSSMLLKDANGTQGSIDTYHTADETFMLIQYDSSSDTWTVKDKTGMVYVFGADSSARASYPTYAYYYIGQTLFCNRSGQPTWRWGLSQATNIYLANH